MKSVGYNSWNSWIALIATTIIGFFSVLPMRLAGIFFIVVRERYNTDREFATVPIVFFGVLRTLLGPFTGYLGETFGCRAVTLIGCVITAIGIGCCYFAESAVVCIISFGFVAGIGFAFAHTLMPTILRQHFNKDFNLINGINMAGCCLGAVIMSPIVQYLTKEYGASGMFLILAAIVLNCVPACILLKNPKNENRKSEAKPAPEKTVSDVSEHSKSNEHFENLGFISDDEKQNGDEQNEQISIIDDPIKTNTSDKSLDDKFKGCESHESNSSAHFKLKNSEQVNNCQFGKKQKDFQRSSEVELVSFSEKSKFDEHSVTEPTNISIHNNVECSRSNSVFRCNNKPPSETNNINTSKTNNKKPVSWQLKHLFTDPAFYCIMLVNSLHAFVNTLNWTVIMDFGIDKGISPDLSVYFVMFLPVAEMIGNLSLNWVVDRKFMTRSNYATLCFIVLGLDSEFIEWSYNFVLTMIAVMIYGFVSGAVRSTFPGMIYDSIDKDKQSMAMASRGLPYGLLCFAKAPVVGYFRGRLGSYKGVYDLLTAFGFLSALFSFLTPLAKSYRDRKNKAANNFK